MQLIIGTDSLNPPLTGIGRYTKQLCEGLLASPQVESMLGYDLGRTHSIESRLRGLGSAQEAPARPGLVAGLRARLAGSVLATRVYRHYNDLCSGWRLGGLEQSVYHSPNFHLPRFAGPSVITVHDLTYKLFPHHHPKARVDWMNRMVPEAVAACSQVICVSESTRRDLLQAYAVEPEKVSVIYPGVEATFRPHSEAEIAATLAHHGLDYRGYFLVVATLEPRKNLERLLEAYLSLPGSLRDHYPLVLVGTRGWGVGSLEAQLAQLPPQQVRRLGYVAESALPALYSGALCFVYPSLYEGFGLPVLEAQASGVPVITSNTSSLPEVASSQASLVDPLDPQAIGSAMRRAAEDGNWREACIHAGLQQARNFSWEQCVAATLEVYRRAAGSA